MATITGTAGDDSILTTGVSPGVTGGVPGASDDVIVGTVGSDAIDAGGGFDTADYSGLVGDVVASFVVAEVAKPGGETDALINVERVVTGAGNDRIEMGEFEFVQGSILRRLFADAGTGTNTVSVSGPGSNIFFADFLSVAGPVNVNLAAGSATGASLFTTLTNVRSARGTVEGDVFVGSSDNNAFMPGRGNNTVDGAGGFDVLDYRDAGAGITVTPDGAAFAWTVLHDGFTDRATGVEMVVGSFFGDAFTGGSGNDWFMPYAGADTVNGGGGYNTVSYHLSGFSYTSGATINLEAGFADDPWGARDTLTNIRAAMGTPLGDTITGRSGTDFYHYLKGMSGDDTLRSPTSGANFNVADYSDNERAGVVANLASGTSPGADGWGGTDTFVDLRGLRGSRFNDTLTGTSLFFTEVFVGSRGSDTIDGGAGGGRNRVDYRTEITGDGRQISVAISALSAATVTKSGGVGVERDNLVNVNDIWGTDGTDTFTLTPGAPGAPFAMGLRGYGGVDTFDLAGNSGVRVDYSGATGRVVATLGASGSASEDGHGSSDILLNVTRIRPSAFADQITGTAANETFDLGQTGLNGWGGAAKILDGGGGVDSLWASLLVRVVVDLGAGTMARYNAAVGGSLVNTDTATNFENAAGGDGNDTITGGDADNRLFGGRGDDLLTGGLGRDTLFFDFFTGNAPAPSVGVNVDLQTTQVIDPWGGTDTFSGIENADGTALADSLTGNDGANVLRGLGGNDWIAGKGVSGGDTLDGGGGDDELWGTAAAETLLGGNGSDVLRGQGAADRMEGGGGNDQYTVFDSGAVVVENAGAGTDTVWSLAPSLALADNVEIGRLVADNALLIGHGGNDTLVAHGANGALDGGAGNDALWGGAGVDALFGGDGDDALRAGGGDDFLEGSAGNDQLVGGAGADRFLFADGDWGYDQVFDFSRAEGDRLVFDAAGVLSLADFVVYEAGGNTALIARDGSRIDLYGVSSVLPSDLVFL